MKDRKFRRIFICLLAVLVLAVSALSVFAKEFTDEDGQMLIETSRQYIESLYTYDDAELEQMKDLGDFYLVTSNMITDEKEELGSFIGVSGKGSWDRQSDNKILVHIPAQYENYKAEIIITFDETGTEPKNFVINPEYSLGEKMFGAFQNFILGILIVFVILVFLAFIISLFRFINPDMKAKRAAEKRLAAQKAAEPEKKEESPAAGPVPAAVPVPAAAGDDEIIVAMAAAIAAAEAENGGNYIVRSIRRAGAVRNWTRS